MDNIDSLMISLVLEFEDQNQFFFSKSLGGNMLNSILFSWGLFVTLKSSEKK